MGRTVGRIPSVGTLGDPNPYRIYIITDTHIGKSGVTTALADKVRVFADRVTQDQPHLALHLGDIYDTTDQRELFLSAWSRIRGVRAIPILGNHEWDPGEITIESLETSFWFQEQPENGGSRFNQTWVLSGAGWPMRVILLDSTFNASNAREKTYTLVRMHDDTPAWLEYVLEEAREPVILLFTHAGPHLIARGYYGDTVQANALKSIVEAHANAHPGVLTRWFFGHYHGPDVLQFVNLGSKNIGYRCPTTLEGDVTRLTIIEAAPGRVSVTSEDLEVP